MQQSIALKDTSCVMSNSAESLPESQGFNSLEPYKQLYETNETQTSQESTGQTGPFEKKFQLQNKRMAQNLVLKLRKI